MTIPRRCMIASLLLPIIFIWMTPCSSFTLVMMGTKRRKGGLKKSLDSASSSPSAAGGGGGSSTRSLNGGKGQEITGVTLPDEGKIGGWEFGKDVRMACANVAGKYYAVQGQCPRCAFDLFKGTLLDDEGAWGPDPRVACPTCGTTFSLKSGTHGPTYRQGGLAGWVGGLAQTATIKDASKDAVAYVITRDADGRVYCRER